ncbi:MAG: molecular chaperone HscC [Lachnospiraceae bacterium]|nr:molecular chaperone HscC [Lachnospiraceae bacterium]
MAKILGIDLGTTNSLAAVWDNGKSVLVPNAFGEYLTPSVVSVDEEGTVYVGKTAKQRLASYPGQTASLFKRFMGTGKQYRLGQKTYLPEELSALVLRKLKEDAEKFLGESVEEAVISVPAYFNDIARNATKRAGAIAGLKVERIINEPSAAALACQNFRQQEDATILVFDFGGGTLDVSLVECFDNIIEIKAVSGDNQLGGQDFDNALAAHFLRSFKIDPENLTWETKAIIRSSAERCKKELTESKTAEMVVNSPQICEKITISRKDLVTICADLFQKMGKPVKRVLMDGKISTDMIDDIVLVGGSCKMPIVRQYLEHILQRKDIETMNPDQMIALGVGVSAGIKERDEEIKDMILTDICPFSLGVNVVNETNPDKKLTSFIIERNSPLPISKEQIYVNSWDGQTCMRFGIYQGEAMYVEDNILLGEIKMSIPPRPKHTVECRVRFTYDINGVLEVNAYIPMTNEEKQMVIVNKELNMSKTQIEEKLKEFSQIKIDPAQDEENHYLMAWGERLFMQCDGEMKEEIMRKMHGYEHVIKTDPYSAGKARKYLTVFLTCVESMLDHYLNWDEKEINMGSWYEDEGDAEMDEFFKKWDEEDL